MTLSEMKKVLSDGQIVLTKSLGQNFLHDRRQLARIAAAGELTAADRVLEIGSGLGPLTELLLQQAGQVLAIEMDQRLVEYLRGRWPGCASLELVHADALDYLRGTPRDWTAWKLVANLPYSVASPILVELALGPHPPERLVATLQLEVVRRLLAKAASDDYGVLTLLVQVTYEPLTSFRIPPTCFFPVPDVDSACVSLRRRPQPLLAGDELARFTRIVKCAFSQRRKMMMKLLKQFWPSERLAEVFRTLSLPVQIRAERVSLLQFVELTRLLGNQKG